MAESPSRNSSASRKRLSIFSRPATKRTTTGRDGLRAKKRSISMLRRDRPSRIGIPCEEPSKLTLSSLLCSPTTICGSKNEGPPGAQPRRPLSHTAMGPSWPRGAEDVRRATNYILGRLRFAHLAHELDAIVGAQLPVLMDDFEEYFPELRAAVVAWKRENG